MASLARTTLRRQSHFLSTSRQILSQRPLSIGSSAALPIAALRRAQPLHRLGISQHAPFSSTSHQKILPPGPQVIEGGVNDPAPVPKPHPIHGSYHWTFERLLSVGLVPLTIAPFAAGSVSPALDAALIFAILVHSHMGFQSIIIDYIPVHRLPTTRKIIMWALNLATLVVGIGFYEFETNDIGLAEAIKRIWHAGNNDATVAKADIGGLGHDGKLKNLTE